MDCQNNDNITERLYETIFEIYKELVTDLCNEFNIELTTSNEKKIFNPRKVYTPQERHSRHCKPIDEIHRSGKGKDGYYLKYSKKLHKMLNDSNCENIKHQYIYQPFKCEFPRFAVFELRYKLHKILPYSEHKYIKS